MSDFIRVEHLSKFFLSRRGFFHPRQEAVRAVEDVSFSISAHETLGLVGESGCGKSTCGRSIIRLYEPSAGSVFYRGVEITRLSQSALFPYRRKMQMIFQDPYASLNPRMTVGDGIGEALAIHRLATGKEARERVFELLHLVGLKKIHASRYPHEFSGGQRQRVGIARALAVEPEFLICDEPISALDVSIQAQIVNMLEELQERLRLTYLFIAHDLSMVRHISHRVGVMYLGKLVELAPKDALYERPLHPYTQALLSAIPIPDPDLSERIQRIELQGDVPSPIHPPSGCRFRTRCRYATERCAAEEPLLREVEKGRQLACHLYDAPSPSLRGNP